MFKELIFGLARSNVLVDLALEVQEQLSRETRAAACAIGIAGFGAGVWLASTIAVALTPTSALGWTGVVTGAFACAGGCGRLFVARQRLMELRDVLTAKAARDAAARAVSVGAGLVSQGLSSVGKAARDALESTGRLFARKGDDA